MSIEWHLHETTEGEVYREVGYTDNIILHINVSSSEKNTYCVSSRYTRKRTNIILVLERAKVFDSMSSAKEWLIKQTLEVLMKTCQDLQ